MTVWKAPTSPEEWRTWLRERLLSDSRVRDERHAAYILATAHHETAGTFDPATKELYGIPTPEQRAKYPTGTPNRYIYFEEKYGHLSRNGPKHGNTRPGDGARYPGRGPAQITWFNNYKRFSDILGIDMIANPDLAHVPEHAYNIIVIGMMDGEFTGVRLSQYIYGDRCDWGNSRRTVNGTDDAAKIGKRADMELAVIRRLRAT